MLTIFLYGFIAGILSVATGVYLVQRVGDWRRNQRTTRVRAENAVHLIRNHIAEHERLAEQVSGVHPVSKGKAPPIRTEHEAHISAHNERRRRKYDPWLR